MTLATDGREFRVTHSSDQFLLLKEPASFPAGSAELILSIDGEISQNTIRVEEVVNSRMVSAPQKEEPASLKVAES